jgi:Amt family ammonium transporter
MVGHSSGESSTVNIIGSSYLPQSILTIPLCSVDAGGVPVEIASGIGGLAYSYFIGKRRGYGTERILYKPHNVGHVILGTILLWVGWLGFNAGSTFAANLKAALAAFNTNLAGSVG